jgi:ATP-dependent Zn protease
VTLSASPARARTMLAIVAHAHQSASSDKAMGSVMSSATTTAQARLKTVRIAALDATHSKLAMGPATQSVIQYLLRPQITQFSQIA